MLYSHKPQRFPLFLPAFEFGREGRGYGFGRERGIILRRYLHANVVDMNVLQRKRPRSDLRMHRGTSRGPAATISHNTARVQCNTTHRSVARSARTPRVRWLLISRAAPPQKRKLKGQIHNWIETIGYLGADTRMTRVIRALRSLRFHSLHLCRIMVFLIQTHVSLWCQNVSLAFGESACEFRSPKPHHTRA